ncbi:ornithine decarboxylase, putative [Ricinus communis]|uniref:ornithine decarboxylase n=1 Tax=Ricinus communis TaxID=3988 RepID=B9R8G8_RICCO|nr:ornithine decarboxylase, putative [Ricinus communis]|eukprot:XP_002510611.1 ornithine decarboxylase isoform X1 [Ricinus communis]
MERSSGSLQVILDAPGVQGKTVTTLSKDSSNLTDYVESIIVNTQVNRESFYVLDLGAVAGLMHKWSRELPMIQPYYAVKCNSEISLIGALAALGCNFDCASKAEIQSILSLGVSPDRIIYANPSKPESHIIYAANVDVNLTTFDSKHELHKISKCHPKCSLLIRIKPPDDSGARWPLGSKFGALPEEIEPLLLAAQAAKLTISGVSFHIGSESRNPHAYRGAIGAAKHVFDTASRLGMPPMRVLNIGGGFIAGSNFDEAATVIKAALQDYFGDNPGIEIISEPGRYFAETVFMLATSITGKRVRGGIIEYWINDGVFGSFSCVIFGVSPPACVPLACTSNRANPKCKGEPTYKSTVYGPTCDAVDKVFVDQELPELEINDWLVFPYMGAYTTANATIFQGFSSEAIFTHLVYSNLI